MGSQVSGSIALDMSKVIETVVAEVRQNIGRQLLRAVAEAELGQVVTEQTMPVLAQLQRQMRDVTALLTSSALGEDDTRATLASCLPAGTYAQNENKVVGYDPRYVAAFQAERLAEAGYALVPISGPALEHVLEAATPKLCAPVPCPPFEEARLEISTDPPEPGAFARAAMGDEWAERTAAQYVANQANRDAIQRAADRTNQTLVERGLVPPQHRVESLLDSGVSNVPGVDVDAYEATARADARLAQAQRDPEDSWREDHN
jgi:hypothetical protein